MLLEGKRIKIRPLDIHDARAYYEYASNIEVARNAGFKPVPSVEVASMIIMGAIFREDTFAIALKNSNKLIGTISISSARIRKLDRVKTLGISISKEYQHQGIGSEAFSLILEYLFSEMCLKVVEIYHEPQNKISEALIRKFKFTYDGRFKAFERIYDKSIIDACVYSMTEVEYRRNKYEK